MNGFIVLLTSFWAGYLLGKYNKKQTFNTNEK
jgi:hypothetical protein